MMQMFRWGMGVGGHVEGEGSGYYARGYIVTPLNFCGIMLLNVIIIYNNFDVFLI